MVHNNTILVIATCTPKILGFTRLKAIVTAVNKYKRARALYFNRQENETEVQQIIILQHWYGAVAETLHMCCRFSQFKHPVNDPHTLRVQCSHNIHVLLWKCSQWDQLCVCCILHFNYVSYGIALINQYNHRWVLIWLQMVTLAPSPSSEFTVFKFSLCCHS